MNTTTLRRTFALLSIYLLGLTACAFFVPEEVNDVVIPTIVVASATPLPFPTLINATVEPRTTSLPLPPTEMVTIPSVAATITNNTVVNPLSTPSPSPTITPMTVIYLTPSAEWQPIQRGNVFFEIPVGWYLQDIPSVPFIRFINIDPTSLPYPLWESDRPLDRPLAYIGYEESSPTEIPETGGEAIMVDDYPALISTFETDGGDIRDISYGLSIYTPVSTYGLGIKCLTHNNIGAAQQQEFLAMCESIVRHWVETTDILE